MFVTQEKKNWAREEPDWGRSETGQGAISRLRYSALVHQGLTLLQAACILRQIQQVPALWAKNRGVLATGHLTVTECAGCFWDKRHCIPSPSLRIQTEFRWFFSYRDVEGFLNYRSAQRSRYPFHSVGLKRIWCPNDPREAARFKNTHKTFVFEKVKNKTHMHM